MEGIQLPNGYTLDNEVFEKEFTILRKEGKIVFAQPVERVTLERVEGVIKQIEAVART